MFLPPGLCPCPHSGMFSPLDLKHPPTDIPIMCFFAFFWPLLKGHLLINTFLATSLKLQFPFLLYLNCYFSYLSYLLLDFLHCNSIRARSLFVFFSLVSLPPKNGFQKCPGFQMFNRVNIAHSYFLRISPFDQVFKIIVINCSKYPLLFWGTLFCACS